MSHDFIVLSQNWLLPQHICCSLTREWLCVWCLFQGVQLAAWGWAGSQGTPQHPLLLAQPGHCWPWHSPTQSWASPQERLVFLTHLGDTQPSQEDVLWLYALGSKQALLNFTFLMLLWAFQAIPEENLKKPVASLLQHVCSFWKNRSKHSPNKKKLDLPNKLKWSVLA